MLVPLDQGSNPSLLEWEQVVLNSGPPGKSQIQMQNPDPELRAIELKPHLGYQLKLAQIGDFFFFFALNLFILLPLKYNLRYIS